jgi:hypothetical protein
VKPVKELRSALGARDNRGETYWFANLAKRDELTRQELSAISPQTWRE